MVFLLWTKTIKAEKKPKSVGQGLETNLSNIRSAEHDTGIRRKDNESYKPMNEAKWQCPFCSRFNLQGVKILVPNDIMKCGHCKKPVIIVSMDYLLHTRKPE